MGPDPIGPPLRDVATRLGDAGRPSILMRQRAEQVRRLQRMIGPRKVWTLPWWRG